MSSPETAVHAAELRSRWRLAGFEATADDGNEIERRGEGADVLMGCLK